jgi:hypothetical protein
MLIRASWRRYLLDALLLPVALVVVVIEDVIWGGARAVLRSLVRLPPVAGLNQWMGHLPGWVAIPLFLVPEAVGRIGEVWAVALLLHGHKLSFLLVYALVRLLATMLAVFVYQACKVALLEVAWFAVLVRWTLISRDWARARLQPMVDRVYAVGRLAPGIVARRFTAMRRWLERAIAGRGT